jgi:hypothetical protein
MGNKSVNNNVNNHCYFKGIYIAFLSKLLRCTDNK